jgi:hypothetical protein
MSISVSLIIFQCEIVLETGSLTQIMNLASGQFSLMRDGALGHAKAWTEQSIFFPLPLKYFMYFEKFGSLSSRRIVPL